MKEISWGREKIFEGMTLVHNAVASTIGPNGENWVLDRGFNASIITNDGVSISEAIEVEDFTQKQGVDLFKFMGKKQREQAGDGTSTTIVLAHALISEGMKYDNPMEVKRSLEKAVEKVVEELKKHAKPVKTDKEIQQVAAIATESEEYGQMIVDVIKAIGKDGVISVEQSQARETQVKIAEGYIVEKGYSNIATGAAQINKAKILVIGEKIESIHSLLPFLEKATNAGIKDLALFCVEMEPEVLNALAEYWKKGIIRVLVIKAATQKQEVLHDVALVSGAEYVSQDSGYRMEDLQVSALGEARRVVSYNGQTTIIEGKGDPKKTIEEFKESLKEITDANEYDLVEKRIARLKHEVAVITVGAATEEAMQYLFYKLQNGVNSTKASIEEGIVAGGGYTLHKIADSLGETVGEKIMKRALKMPLRKIIENGKEDYTEVLLKMPAGKGYNARTQKYTDLIKDGVIDPVRVERCALENATSLAAHFLTVHGSVALVRDLPVKGE